MNYIVGLGNPDKDYFETRHNIGREVVKKFIKKNKLPDLSFDKKINALISVGDFVFFKEARKTAKKVPVTIILPETYMNNSGSALRKVINTKKKKEMTTVIYDDLDLALGNVKMNFNKGSGGHKGLESIIKALGGKNFNRIRVGISKCAPTGKIKKPKGDEQVIKHVLGRFSPQEKITVKKVLNRAVFGLEQILMEGRVMATNIFNSGK